jgi:hypothetical protein
MNQSRFSGKNLSDFARFAQVGSYGVAEWTPGRDGEGKPEAVMLHFELAHELDGVTFGIRLKTARSVDTLIDLLAQYRDMVWPLHKRH